MPAKTLINILDKNHQNHIPNQPWFAACGGIYNSFDGEELDDVTAAAVSYRLAACHNPQSADELRQEIESNYSKSHANIGATIAAFKQSGFDMSSEEERMLRSLDSTCGSYTPKAKTYQEQYAEQVEILNNLEFSVVEENLRFHHATTPAENFYLREKLLNKTSSTVYYDAYRLRIPVQPITPDRNEIASFQAINIQGKKFESGYRVKGTAHFIPSKEAVFESSEVVICEGYATGESIYQGSGIPVVCAMSKSNMLLAAVALTQNRTFELTLAADNDAIDECRKIIGIVNTDRGSCECMPAGIIKPDNDKSNGDFSDDWVVNGGAL